MTHFSRENIPLSEAGSGQNFWITKQSPDLDQVRISNAATGTVLYTGNHNNEDNSAVQERRLSQI
jgi:hypothetical protein